MSDIGGHLHQALRDDLPSCGCGNPDAADRLIIEILRLAPLHQDHGWRKAEALIGSEGAFQIVVGAMNTAELLEHAGAIGGSWLAQKGRWVLWALEQIGGLDQLETVIDEAGYGWCERTGAEPCTAECWATPDGWTETAGTPVAASDEQRMATFQEDRDAARRIQQNLTERYLGFAWPPRAPSAPTAALGRQRFNQQTRQWEAAE